MFQACDCNQSLNLRAGLGDGASDMYDDAYCYDFHARGIPLEDAGNRCNRIYEELNALAVIPAAAIDTAPNMPIEWHLEQKQYAENLRDAGFTFDDVSAPAYLAPYLSESMPAPAPAPQTDFLVRETAANYFDAEPEFGFTPDARPVTYATPAPAPAPGGGSVIGNLIQQMQQMEAPSLAPSGSVAPSIAPAPSLPPAPAPSAGSGSTGGGGGGGVIVAPVSPLAPLAPAPAPAPVVWDELAGGWVPSSGGSVNVPGAAGEQFTQAAGLGRIVALALLALPFFNR